MVISLYDVIDKHLSRINSIQQPLICVLSQQNIVCITRLMCIKLISMIQDTTRITSIHQMYLFFAKDPKPKTVDRKIHHIDINSDTSV